MHKFASKSLQAVINPNCTPLGLGACSRELAFIMESGHKSASRILVILFGFLIAAGMLTEVAEAQLPIVSVEDFAVTETFSTNLICNGSFLSNLNNATVPAIEVPGGTTNDVQLRVAARVPGVPFAIVDKQTFQFTKYGVGASALVVPGVNVDVAYQVKNRVSGKCWDDNGGAMGQNLFQKACVTNIGNGLLTSGLRQLFRLLPVGTPPNCTPAAGSAGDQIYLIQSLASLVENLQRRVVEGNCITSVYRDPPASGLQPTWYVCDTNAPNERYLLSSKPLG